MKKIIITLLLLHSFFIYSNYEKTKSFIVKDIMVKGLQHVTQKSLLLKIPIHIGEKVTNKKISDTIKKLFNTGNFDSIKIYKDNKKIIIKVKENPIIGNIIYKEKNSKKNKILKNFLKLEGIQLGKVLNLTNISNIERNIKKYYYNNGKYNVKIKIKTIFKPNNIVNLELSFDEGLPTKIIQINFIGNNSFSTKQLISNLKLNKKNFLSKLFSNNKFKKQTLLEDIEKLKKIYVNNGYIRFKIYYVKLNLTPNKKNLYITYYMNEGHKYKLSQINILGNVVSYENKIKKLINLNPGELFNQSKIFLIEKKINKLLNFYGYAFSKIETKIKINDKNHTVKLNFHINPGKRLYVNQIKFQGNYLTKDIVLRREIKQMESSWLNKNLIFQGKKNLNKLGFFENINLKINPILNSSDMIDIIYQIKERKTGSFNFGAGWDQKNKLNLQFNIKQKNWLGTGNNIEFIGTKNHTKISSYLNITNKFFTINGFNLNTKIFFNKFYTNEKNIFYYDLKNWGLIQYLSYPINKTNIFSLGIDYTKNNMINMYPHISLLRYIKKNNIFQQIMINNQLNKRIYFYTNDILLMIDWNYNNLYIKSFPQSGSYININSKITLPSSINDYYKINLLTENYLPFNGINNWILMSRINIGYANGFKGKEIPLYENFFIGRNLKSNTIRGFYPNTLGPKAVYYLCNKNEKSYDNCTLQKSNDAIGSNASIITNTELILPNKFLMKNIQNLLRTSIFIDTGTIWDTNWISTPNTDLIGIPNYNNPNQIRVSGGVSLQLKSPIGKLVFSYAIPIKKYEEDKSELFQFNIEQIW